MKRLGNAEIQESAIFINVCIETVRRKNVQCFPFIGFWDVSWHFFCSVFIDEFESLIANSNAFVQRKDFYLSSHFRMSYFSHRESAKLRSTDLGVTKLVTTLKKLANVLEVLFQISKVLLKVP